MATILDVESTLTDRYQTTIPEIVRRALNLEKRDKISYAIRDNGDVVLTRLEEDDPLLAAFLSFLAQDIKTNPTHLQVLGREAIQQLQSLVHGMDIDLNAPLSADDE